MHKKVPASSSSGVSFPNIVQVTNDLRSISWARFNFKNKTLYVHATFRKVVKRYTNQEVAYLRYAHLKGAYDVKYKYLKS